MISTFPGGIFSDTIDDGRSGAEIALTPSGVSARLPNGDSFLIPYRDCQVEIGGNSGRMVFCRNCDRSLTIFCEDRKFPKELSFAASGTLDAQLGDSLRQRKSQSRRERLVLISVLSVLIVLAIGSYLGLRAGAKVAVHALPTSVDHQIGSAAFASMDLGGPEINDEIVVGAMQSIVDRLAPEAAIDSMQFEVHVIQSPSVNAFALPGGKIVVFTGLIQNAGNADQVAAVLGHEMAHATLRHGLQRISHSMGIWAAVSLLIGDASGVMAAGVNLFQIATINSYSREQENAADEEGIRMMHGAGIDPKAMAQFFQLLEEEHAGLPEMLTWVSTHPDHASRIANIKDKVAALPHREYRPIELDWAKIQARLNQNDSFEIDSKDIDATVPGAG